MPIQWIYNDIEQLSILNQTESIGSEYVLNYAFQIVDMGKGHLMIKHIQQKGGLLIMNGKDNYFKNIKLSTDYRHSVKITYCTPDGTG